METKETKKCPYCGGEILAVATKCKHCRKWLPKDEESKETPPEEAESGQTPVEPETTNQSETQELPKPEQLVHIGLLIGSSASHGVCPTA